MAAFLQAEVERFFFAKIIHEDYLKFLLQTNFYISKSPSDEGM